jgi:hypothetical protein
MNERRNDSHQFEASVAWRSCRAISARLAATGSVAFPLKTRLKALVSGRGSYRSAETTTVLIDRRYIRGVGCRRAQRMLAGGGTTRADRG